ncbi:MAG: zinc-dependent metalloprotease, partial [Bacteroidales bacterium]|nr:zinc-dependent metalloprotease [Bacteroidales bacterium]
MEKINQIIVLWLCMSVASLATAQNMVYYEIQQAKADKIPFTSIPDVFTTTKSDFKSENYFTHPEEVSFFDYTPVNLDNQEAISFSIPASDGTLIVELLKTPADHFQYDVATSDGKVCPANPDIKHYRGIVQDNPNSWVAVTFFDKEIMATIATEKGNFNLGKERASGQYIFYNESNLQEHSIFSCETADDNSVRYDSAVLFQAAPPSVEYIRQAVAQNTLKAVGLYFETEYDILHSLGSIAAVEAYITGLFNQVATLYINERIITYMSRLNVWIGEDPYTATNTSDLLTQFQNWRSDFPGAFIGNLGQLLTFRDVGGGRAVVNGLCNAKISKRLSVAQIKNESLTPDYCWSVDAVTHEFGHLLGSRHTHDCVWNGNNTAIDGCGEISGCPDPGYPPNGGTIMSYCQNVPGVNIDFSLGFGPQPGNVIRYSVANASCLPSVPQFNISGASSISVCEPQTYYLTGTPMGGLHWRVSPHLLILSEENRKIVVQPISASSGTAYIAVDLIIGGQAVNTIQKNITISGMSLPSPISREDINITSNATWSGMRTLATTAYVTSGGTLTITGDIVCTANAAIRVSAGGRLIIDGGTLTSACNGEMWKGITVFTPSNSQLEEGQRYQGVVRMVNGATIANAQKGINIYGVPYTTFSGNMVNASNSYFVNNQIAVNNEPAYWQLFPNNPLILTEIYNAPCRFNECTFKMNGQYFFTYPFLRHVFLRSVKGVTFTACTFKNEWAGDEGTAIGIEAVNAGFTVEGYCSNRYSLLTDGSCPEADLTRSLFQGFNRGISVTGTATNLTTKIDQATFINNLTGVYVNAINNVSILRSNFNLGKATQTIKKGVHLLNSTGFRVEENSFAGTLPNASGLYGLVVENSGSNNNEIYKNR